MASLAIGIVTYESAPWLERCAAGVRGQTIEAEVVVVDNASKDGSAELAAELLPSARIISNSRNTGFAAAANQAIAATTAEFFLLLNPDAHLLPRYGERLMDALAAAGERFGAATGKLLRGMGESIEPTGIVDSKGIRMTRSGRHFDIDAGLPDTEQQELVREVFGVSGAAALYRRSFLEDVKIGGESFDESFFAYREDADLAWRGRLFGWQAVYVPDALAYHVRRVTPERRKALPAEINFHSVKNRFLLRLKNETPGLAVRHALFEIPRDLIVLGATLTVERSSFPAWRWLWQHRASILEKRRQIQQRRRVSDRDLLPWFGG